MAAVGLSGQMHGAVLLPKDYVRFRLTGERATDVADASGTLLFDVANRRWSTEMLDAMQIDPGLLPSVHEGPDVTSRLTTQAASTTGLRVGTPVLAGVGAGRWATVDEACDAVTAVAETIEPAPEHVATLDEGYARFRTLYRALHPA